MAKSITRLRETPRNQENQKTMKTKQDTKSKSKKQTTLTMADIARLFQRTKANMQAVRTVRK